MKISVESCILQIIKPFLAHVVRRSCTCFIKMHYHLSHFCGACALFYMKISVENCILQIIKPFPARVVRMSCTCFINMHYPLSHFCGAYANMLCVRIIS